jgi:ABC-2 type transport system ATP-binding protein
MIAARDVEKRFGPRAVLRGLNLDVDPGELTLLVGANGAGKTTLVRIICGLCLPDRGSVRVGGHEVVGERLAALGTLAFLPQAPRFHPRLTTVQVARYYGRLRGRSGAEVAAELNRWGLDDHLAATTAQLSGGLRQRLAIAIFALARTPVLVLDEPGLSLDPEWRLRLQAHLSAAAQRGAAVLVATHLLGEWEGKVDRCVVLSAGRVSGTLPPNRLRESFGAVERSAGS